MESLRSTLLIALSLAAFATEALASPKVISVPFTKRNNTSSIAKRDPFAASLENYLPGVQYFVTAAIGTPSQTIELIVDTGSSDTWMFAPGACTAGRSGPCLGGSFDPSQSTTYRTITNLGTYRNRYGDGSKVEGPYFSDNFGVGGQTVKGLTMGLVGQSVGTIRAGIMGMGLDTNEAITATRRAPYPNFPDLLFSQKLIASKAFSLYLDDLDASTGSILFGGYDTDKFSGEMKMLPIQKDVQTGTIASYTVSLTGLAASFQGKSLFIEVDQYPVPVILDSGTTLAYIPATIFDFFVENFHLRRIGGTYIVDCNIKQLFGQGTIDFIFGDKNGPRIAVPIEELAVPLYNPDLAHQFLIAPGERACAFGLLPQAPGLPYVLGQTFLRSAYVLYDLDNFAVGLAQAKYGVSSSNIIEYNSNGSNKDVTTDTGEPVALETPGGGRPVGVPFSVTVTRPIPSPYDNVPYPNGVPAPQQPTTLSPQVTPVNEGSGSSGGGKEGGGGKGSTKGGGGGKGSTKGGGGGKVPSGKGSGSSTARGTSSNPTTTSGGRGTSVGKGSSGPAAATGAALPAFSPSTGLLNAGTMLAALLGAVVAL